MLQVGVSRCVECGAQKMSAHGWVMLVERGGNLVVAPVWNKREARNTLHFCGRSHVIRYVDRWIGNSGVAPRLKLVRKPSVAKVAEFPAASVAARRATRPAKSA